DHIDGGTGADLILAGTGNDTIVVDPAVTQEDIAQEEGRPKGTINGEAGIHGLLVLGTPGHDNIRITRPGDAARPHAGGTVNGLTSDVIYKTGETITVRSGRGNDLVILDETAAATWSARFDGEAGDDVLIGAARDDVLIGGPGRDVLIGNGGVDTLVGDRN